MDDQGFSKWAGKKIRASQRRKKKQKAAADKAIAAGATVDTGWHSSLSSAQKWALENPDNAKYDNDGNPVDSSHWGF